MIYACLHRILCVFGVWTCILHVWTCILDILTCIWMSGLVFWVSGLLFWVSGLVFRVSRLVFWVQRSSTHKCQISGKLGLQYSRIGEIWDGLASCTRRFTCTGGKERSAGTLQVDLHLNGGGGGSFEPCRCKCIEFWGGSCWVIFGSIGWYRII